MTHMEQYIKHYDDHYKRFGLRGCGEGKWEHRIEKWKAIGYEDGMTVLDYGCGWGSMLPGIENKAGYVGVDISPEAVRLGKEKFPGVRIEVFEPGKLDVGKFDFVCAHSVFTHTPKESVVMCLKDIREAMKDFAIIDVLFGKDNGHDMHVRHYANETEWFSYLDEAGLKGRECATYTTYAGYQHHYYKVEKK